MILGASEVLPCPWCGRREVLLLSVNLSFSQEKSSRKWYTICRFCRARGPECRAGPLAKEKWNKREECERLRVEIGRLFDEGQQAKRERNQHVAWLDDAKVMISTLKAECDSKQESLDGLNDSLRAAWAERDAMREVEK